jgi:hypothetical protein
VLLAAVVAVAAQSVPRAAMAQAEGPADHLTIRAQSAATWGEGSANVIQLSGPVVIEMDRTRMVADGAVVWLTPLRGSVIEQRRAEIVLLGNARVEMDEVSRSGEVLQVTGTVRGAVRVTSEERVGRDLSGSEFYGRANQVRPSNVALAQAPEPTSQPATATSPRFAMTDPVSFRAPGELETFTARDGKLAVVLSGGVTLLQDRADGSLIELLSERAVLFTNIERLTDLQKEGEGPKSIEESIRSAYLEGDIRIVFTPAPGAKIGEQRLTGDRAFYEFNTDRAVLTEAVLHSTSPEVQVPLVVRADTLRQLSRSQDQAEYATENTVLTTSEFATPSFDVAARKAYIRQSESTGPMGGTVTTYAAEDVTLRGFGIPYFYLPAAGGTVRDDMPLRSAAVGSNSRFGFFTSTTWGLFPTLGRPNPPDVDAAYTVGFWGDRGPGAGLDGEYSRSYLSEPNNDPWSFAGGFRSFFVHDQGVDYFGGARTDVRPEEEFRGRVLWTHQHFLPGDWQVQLRAGWVSDPTFLEQWFQRDFYRDEPHDVSAYVKKQTDTEALTLLGSVQPNGFVTTDEMYQEQFEVERYPEIGYHRIGDSPFGDRFTFFSDNSLSALRFNRSDASLGDLGFPSNVSPGIPAVGVAGATDVPQVPEDTTYRGDFRQQLDYPFSVGQVKVVPYVMERYGAYSTSLSGEAKNRFLTAGGARMGTSFWKVNDRVDSELFDVHRMRHIVEPEVHVFTSASAVDAGDLYIYDQEVDRVNDISAAQLALHQTWQTKRGGPGRWRNVDFLRWDVEGNFFANTPDDPELQPTNFRGLFYGSLPEASIPRNSINSSAAWRVSDTLVVLADESYNIEENTLATASAGIAVRRDPRVSYFFGIRYIEPLDSTIGTAMVIYQISKKYQLALSQSHDFAATNNVNSAAEVTRFFDKFWASFRVYHDSISDQSGIGFLIYPAGFGPSTGATAMGDLFGNSNQNRR